MLPLVSIVTSTHLRPKELQRCCQSVDAQPFDDWEHIIVFDGPQPIPELTETSGRRRIVELGHNYGYWHANNGTVAKCVGAYLARGRYVAYIDDDNEWYTNHLTATIKKLNEGFDLVYSQVHIVWEEILVGNLHDDDREYAVDSSCIVHAAELLRLATWTPDTSDTRNDDWRLFDTFRHLGAAIGKISEVTVRYHLTPTRWKKMLDK